MFLSPLHHSKPVRARRTRGWGEAGPGARPRWSREHCFLCGGCVPMCPAGALTVYETFLDIDSRFCTGCGRCIPGCPTGALTMGAPLDESGKRGAQ
ncbi:MAG: 4Fe-4S dicluster domain-containing protein [Thermoplasmatota archaeon]